MNILSRFKKSQTAFRIGAMGLLLMYLLCGLFNILVIGNVRAQLKQINAGYIAASKHGYLNNEAAKTLIKLIDHSALKESRTNEKPANFHLHTAIHTVYLFTNIKPVYGCIAPSKYLQIPVCVKYRVLRI